MRRFLRGFAAVLVCVIFAGCCTTATDPVSAPAPDVSIANIFPQPAGEDFPLAGPEFVVYDLSKLRIGMTKTQVQTLFGKPLTVKQTPKAEYWEYDWFELYFQKSLLSNWFDLPEAPRRKFSPSSQSSQAGRRGFSAGR